MKTILILILLITGACGMEDEMKSMDAKMTDMDKKLDTTNGYMKELLDDIDTAMKLARQFVGLDPTPQGQVDISPMKVEDLTDMKNNLQIIADGKSVDPEDQTGKILSQYTVSPPPVGIDPQKGQLVYEISNLLEQVK